MPRDGSVTFGDLISQLDHLEIVCSKCVWLGRYSVRGLALQHGRDAKISDWIALMTKDCPRNISPVPSDPCGAHCPALSKIADAQTHGGDGNDAA